MMIPYNTFFMKRTPKSLAVQRLSGFLFAPTVKLGIISFASQSGKEHLQNLLLLWYD
jgi:hypothetical protein